MNINQINAKGLELEKRLKNFSTDIEDNKSSLNLKSRRLLNLSPRNSKPGKSNAKN